MKYEELIGKRTRALYDIKLIANSSFKSDEEKVKGIKEILRDVEELEKAWEEEAKKYL